MIHIKEQFITDNKGHKSAVIIPFYIYQKIINILEDAEDLRDFKRIKKEKSIPYDNYRQQRSRYLKHV